MACFSSFFNLCVLAYVYKNNMYCIGTVKIHFNTLTLNWPPFNTIASILLKNQSPIPAFCDWKFLFGGMGILRSGVTSMFSFSGNDASFLECHGSGPSWFAHFRGQRNKENARNTSFILFKFLCITGFVWTNYFLKWRDLTFVYIFKNLSFCSFCQSFFQLLE